MNLLDQALSVSTTTRKAWLRNLTTAQRERLQAEMSARQNELGITRPKATAPAPPKLDEDRYNSIRSGSFIGGQRAIRVGRHVVMIPATAKYKRTRDTLCYVYFRGVVSGYVAKGAKLSKLNMDGPTRAHIARSLFNVKT
jgi:hypothetical protein